MLGSAQRKNLFRGLPYRRHFNEASSSLSPFCIYTHDRYPTQPSAQDLQKWLKEIIVDNASADAANPNQ